MKHRPADKAVLLRHILRLDDGDDIGAVVFRLGFAVIALLGAAEAVACLGGARVNLRKQLVDRLM